MPATSGELSAARMPNATALGHHRAQRESVQVSSTRMMILSAQAVRQGPSFSSYCKPSACSTAASEEAALVLRPRSSMSVTPAPSVAGMVSFASDVTSRRAVLTVSSDSNRPDIRAKTADNSPARGRS